ncbi:MAG: hypothetical protein LRY27_02930 [Chitinophagales bacterium]|nr:hypothetical protein [Chitinophagales bacterium]
MDKECEYFSEEGSGSYWNYASWVLTETGATFIPDYPHAMTPCEDEFPITYKEIESYK